MLSNVWGSVPAGDKLTTATLNSTKKDIYYNMLIPELKALRLSAVGGGNYYFNSYNGFSYDSNGIIQNDGSTHPGKNPFFYITRGLGFESDEYYGNTTGAKAELNTTNYQENVNFHFTMRAHSAFVYYEEANLFFRFIGDDDVYFFVNGHLICDIGGIHGSPQRTVYLNDKIDELGLKEGDICTFDMFFGDRHLTGINLHFTTNILMMNEEVITYKEQYNPSTMVDIKDGTAVLKDSDVGYGFSMLNRREFAVTDLSFDDSSLGVTISPTEMKLNSLATVGGLTLTYQTYDSVNGVLHEATASTPSYSSFYPTLDKAINDPKTTINPLEKGVYRLTGLTQTQVQNLLKLGLPAHTKLTITGLKTKVATGSYTNTVDTSCIPLDIDGNSGDVIYGSASRTIYGIDMTAVTAKEPAQFVIDYAKAVEFHPNDLKEHISYDKNSYQLSFAA